MKWAYTLRARKKHNKAEKSNFRKWKCMGERERTVCHSCASVLFRILKLNNSTTDMWMVCSWQARFTQVNGIFKCITHRYVCTVEISLFAYWSSVLCTDAHRHIHKRKVAFFLTRKFAYCFRLIHICVPYFQLVLFLCVRYDMCVSINERTVCALINARILPFRVFCISHSNTLFSVSSFSAWLY